VICAELRQPDWTACDKGKSRGQKRMVIAEIHGPPPFLISMKTGNRIAENEGGNPF
jgi:hypothetical protein